MIQKLAVWVIKKLLRFAPDFYLRKHRKRTKKVDNATPINHTNS